MGMGFPFGSSRRCCGYQEPTRGVEPAATIRQAFGPSEPPRETPSPRKGDPIPARFHIQRVFVANGHIAAEVVWPDASNYEGRKIALYRCTLAELSAAKTLDPHFNEKRGPLVPIARFEPTEYGWSMAVEIVKCIGS